MTGERMPFREMPDAEEQFCSSLHRVPWINKNCPLLSQEEVGGEQPSCRVEIITVVEALLGG